MSKRNLKIKFAGRLIDLLGQQMYGGAVPAVAELVANAWDADAKKVEITIPADVKSVGAEIKVQDFGEGMTFDELNEYYLHIGYERRERGETTNSGRKVMGRKGIGKLAGFGIAENIVLHSVKDGHLTEFTLNYTKLRSLKSVEGWEFKADKDEPSSEPSGVTVIFKSLKLAQSIHPENFRKSMARRFAISSDEMEISVNGKPITKEDIPLEYRYPEKAGKWTNENIPGFGKIQYWFGFQKTTIDDPELQGITIYARKRVAQGTPFFFNLTGGFNGQVGKEYLTGQIIANPLDEKTDYVATDRQTVNWQFGNAPLFEAWGKQKIKELCADWKKKVTDKKLKKFKHKLGDYFKRIDKLSSPQERKDVSDALEKIATIERISEDDFKIIASSMISGVERESVKKVIKRINAASDEALPELYEAIKEWDIISAVATAEVVLGKLAIIDQFENHIENRLKEKGKKGELDMQTFIKDYPWLLGHDYEQLTPADFHHEKGVDKWIQEILKETDKEFSSADKKDKRRFDLVCIKNEWSIIVLELMRPGEYEDYDHVIRLNRYVTRIQSHINDNKTSKKFKGKTVFGLLIADYPSKDASLGATKIAFRQNLESITWKGLFETVQANYREYYDLLRKKAPDDPRLKGLVKFD
jgi:hypothetical protein